MADLDPLVALFAASGRRIPAIPEAAHLVAYGHRLASLKSLPGVSVEAQATDAGIDAHIVVAEGIRLDQPIHLCMGLFANFSVQAVRLALTLEPRAAATVWAHCLFDAPAKARHAMQADVRIMEGASLRHEEVHHHGTSGNVEVVPHARIRVAKGGRYVSDFSLVQGRVGRLDIDYSVAVGEAAVAELTTRVYGFGSDIIRLRERMTLDGAGARGQVKSRVAVRDDAIAEVFGSIEGNAAGARGHMDCTEIVRDRAQVAAVPEVRVRHPQAKVTHEAAIGSVDGRQLETLMARGLGPDEAVDLIVRGLLA